MGMGRTSIGLLVLSILVAGLFLTLGGEPLPGSVSPAPATTVSLPKPVSTSRGDTPPVFVGVVLPAEAADVTARTEGRIVALGARPGAQVQRGDLLATLDTEALAVADLRIAEVEVTAAAADLKRLQLEVEHAGARRSRTEALAASQLVAAQSVEEARFEEKVAAARLAAAEVLVPQKRAVLQQRQTLVENARITAPMRGTVSVQYVEQGTTVSRGTPVFRIVQADAPRLRFAVPSEEAVRIRRGMRVAVEIPPGDVRLTGVIDAIAPEIDSASQMLLVYATIDRESDPEGSLGPIIVGRSARVRLVEGSR